MKDEYIIINKTAIQKRIEELKFQREREPDNNTQSFLNGKIKQLKQILSQSTPLIPEIEKAFDEGKGVGIISYQPRWHIFDRELYNERKQDYISNLKLDI